MLPRGLAWGTGCLLMVLTGTLTGCGAGAGDAAGPARYAIKGTVTINKEPLEEGLIRLIPAQKDQAPTITATISRGVFELPAELGPTAGPHRVEIESRSTGGIAPDDEAAFAELASGKRKLPKPVYIPAQYNTRSTLKQVISAEGPNELTFDLTSRKSH